MKGTVLDFLNLAVERPELAKELLELATKYDFEFTDEVSDEQLDDVAGGANRVFANMNIVQRADSSGISSAVPGVCRTPGGSSPSPIPYPNVGESEDTGTTTKSDTTKG